MPAEATVGLEILFKHGRIPNLQIHLQQTFGLAPKVLNLMVGLPGFEPGTSCTPSKRASQAAPQPESTILPHVALKPWA
jgi:hypothetical protein